MEILSSPNRVRRVPRPPRLASLNALEVAPNHIDILPLAQLEANLGLDTQMKEMRIRDMRNVLKAPVGQV